MTLHYRLMAVAMLSAGLATASNANELVSEPIEHFVEITGFKFVPESVSVKAGDTITWINKDIAPHTATADNNSFNTGELKFNESGSITVSGDQVVTYYCVFHPMMKAKVLIK